MNSRSAFVLVSSIVLVGIFSIMARATPIVSQQSTQQEEGIAFEYAQLIVNGDPVLDAQNTQVMWNDGDRNLTPNYVSISALNRILSRRALRPTIANLLNTIGADGWEMISIVQNTRDVSTWTFKREL